VIVAISGVLGGTPLSEIMAMDVATGIDVLAAAAELHRLGVPNAIRRVGVPLAAEGLAAGGAPPHVPPGGGEVGGVETLRALLGGAGRSGGRV